MKKIHLLTIVMVTMLAGSLTTTLDVSATKGWTKADNPPSIRHTASNPGSTKICGDHKCAPFEDAKKSFQNILKQMPLTKLNKI